MTAHPTVRPLLFVCACAVAFGVYLRVQQLAFPAHLTFDEHHFVDNARNYLAGKADWNDHPPLGKLLMAAAMHALGDNPVGWRMAALCFGLASIALAFLAARALFADVLAGALAAAFVALDGFLLGYSRTALLDGMLVCFGLCALWLVAPGARPRRLLAAGAVMGLAASIKLSGVTLALPIALAVFASRERSAIKLALLGGSGLAMLSVYYAQYAVGQRLTGLPASPTGVVAATSALVKHHAALTQMTNPATSHWYTWFVPLRPITMRYDVIDGGWVRAMTTVGNPLLWWSSAALMFVALGGLAWLAARELLGRPGGSDQSAGLAAMLERSLPVSLPCAAWVGFMSPWVLTARDSYLYHYLPSYGFGLILLAGAGARAFQRWPRALLIAVLLVCEVSVFYAPVWAQLPLTPDAYALRLFLPAWR